MLSLPPSVRIYLATQAVDGRKGMDSLAAMTQHVLARDPLSGHLFVFFSKRRNRARILYWDRGGFALWTKRLEQGRFPVEFAQDGCLKARQLDATELMLILEGVELVGVRRQPRWEPRRAHARADERRTTTRQQRLGSSPSPAALPG